MWRFNRLHPILMFFAVSRLALAAPVVTGSFSLGEASGLYTYAYNLSYPDNALNEFSLVVQIGENVALPFPRVTAPVAHTEPAGWGFTPLCSTYAADPAGGPDLPSECWIWIVANPNVPDATGSAAFTVTTDLPPSMRWYVTFDPNVSELFRGQVIGPGAPDIPPQPPLALPEPATVWMVSTGGFICLVLYRTIKARSSHRGG